MKFKFYHQLDASDCGPACLKMIAGYYGKSFSIDYFRKLSYITKDGVNLLNIAEAAESTGFKTLKLQLTAKILIDAASFPCIIYWNKQHFVVLHKVKKHFGRFKFHIADPGHGMRVLDQTDFFAGWLNPGNKGFALFMEPTEAFYDIREEDKEHELNINPKKVKGYQFLLKYLIKYKKSFFQLICGILASSVFSLIFPFLTQNIVDVGIRNKDLGFIFSILIFQLFIFLGNVSIDFIKSYLILHIGARINISLISDFLTKIMKLPIRFFESKNLGDLLQRIDDHKRIESFLTNNILGTLFSIINLFVLSLVLAFYNLTVFSMFLGFSILTVLWTVMFLEKRKNADYRLFALMSRNRDNQMEILNGMQEIKLNNFELYQKWQWEKNQSKLFHANLFNLSLEQYQTIGSSFFTQLKNIVITYYAAKLVIHGDLTLGMLLSISFIVGQLNGPIEQLITFIKSAQNAKLSLDRMKEIHNEMNESEITDNISGLLFADEAESKSGIYLQNVYFQYEGPKSPLVLEDLCLHIPHGKITAIVGVSGSGKSTLLKLLNNFYQPVRGEIFINNVRLDTIQPNWWRQQCGVVLQEGYIFSETIARNIAMGADMIDTARLNTAIEVANIKKFITELPLGLNTRIGPSGAGLSTGQKQRILIARAVYKNPDYLFFDEATSALDANNEKAIVENLGKTFEGKTVVVIAHRLSTVKNADQIVVLDKGKIVEIGDHLGLTKNSEGVYFNLVKNQLELGN